jgi:hypothetical protein
LAFLEAYADETGIHNEAERFCFGGLVGPVDDWLSIEKPWKVAMSKAGLDPEKVAFHMTDCVSGGRAFRSIPREARTVLVDDLVSILASAQCFGRLIAIQRGKPETRVGLPKWPAADPYLWAFPACLRLICEAAVAFIDAEEKIAFVFDHQTEWQSVGLKVFGHLSEGDLPYSRRLGSITYRKSLAAVPLQAADLITWEMSHESARVIEMVNPQPRRTYLRLENTGRIARYELLEENLLQLVGKVEEIWRKLFGEGVVPVRIGRPGSPATLQKFQPAGEE